MNTTTTAGTILINEMILPYQRVALRAIASWVNYSAKSYRKIPTLYHVFIDFRNYYFSDANYFNSIKNAILVAIYRAVLILGAYETHHDDNLHVITSVAQRIFAHDHIHITVCSCSTDPARKPHLAS